MTQKDFQMSLVSKGTYISENLPGNEYMYLRTVFVYYLNDYACDRWQRVSGIWYSDGKTDAEHQADKHEVKELTFAQMGVTDDKIHYTFEQLKETPHLLVVSYFFRMIQLEEQEAEAEPAEGNPQTEGGE